jgi:hypothetical protein
MVGTAIGMVSSASAQTAPAASSASNPFADVPADNWAYQAVNTLQQTMPKAVVIGYPDGTFGGRRAMTRYEFAVAIARVVQMIQPPVDTSQFAKTSDFSDFQSSVNDKLTQNQQALDALNALVQEFKPELEALRGDVSAIQAQLKADEDQLKAVEAEQARLKITADVNMIAEAADTTDNEPVAPLSKNGQRISTLGGNESLLNDINVYHDIVLTFDGKVSDNSNAILMLDEGNYLNSVTGNTFTAASGTSVAPDVASVYEAYYKTPVDLGITSGTASIGRVDEQFTQYTLKMINPDVYTDLPETASGNYIVDGAKLNFAAGPTSVNVYAGKSPDNGALAISAGPNILAPSGIYRPGSFGMSTAAPYNPIDQSAGVRVTYGNPSDYVIGVTGLVARTPYADSAYAGIDPYKGTDYNNLAVYGVDFNGNIPYAKVSGLSLYAEFANSATGLNSSLANVNSSHGTEAYDAELKYNFGQANVQAGYRDIYANFAAPGDWGRIGDYINPTNVRGPVVHASYDVTPTLSIMGDGNFYQGQYDDGYQNPLGKNDDLTQFDLGAKYGINKAYDLNLGYEWVQWNLKNDQMLLPNSGKPVEDYITIGVGHSFNQNATLKLLYQIIDYKDDNTGFDPQANGGNEHGGVAVTQLSVKF